MAQHLDDCAHLWGEDLQVSPTGDLLRCNGAQRSKEHVLRRLLTNAGGYLSHLDYGAGLPARIGSLLRIPELLSVIRGQMKLEASVAHNPEPTVDLTELPDGVSAAMSYVTKPEQQPVSLAFNLDG